MTTKDLLQQAQGLLTQALAGLPPDVLPPFYVACNDRVVRLKPLPVPLGPAGFAFHDPWYDTPIQRVTDINTNGGQPYRVPSNAAVTAWACNSKRFHVMDGGGGAKVFDYDGQHFEPSSMQIPSAVEPWFSYTDPDVAYGSVFHNIVRYHANGDRDVICDLRALYPQYGLPDEDPGRDYLAGLSMVDGDTWTVLFGGGVQDHHFLIHHSLAGLFDSSKEPIPFRIHGQGVDRTGRWVFIFPVGADIERAGQVVIWDTQTGMRTSLTKDQAPGHGVLGYGTFINQQGQGALAGWENLNWLLRNISSPLVTQSLLTALLTPPEEYISDHTSWRHCVPDVLRPVVSAIFRYGHANADGVNAPDGLNLVKYPWRACDDEIVAIETNGSGELFRLLHHQSIWTGVYEDQPMINVSSDGHGLLFHSNWGLTVGIGRQDVFLARI